MYGNKVTVQMTDFEVEELYQSILHKLKLTKLMINLKREACVTGDLVEVSIFNFMCGFDAEKLLEHVESQENIFRERLKEVQNRILRNEGKVG